MSAAIEVPVVRRARGYRLYLADGRRLIDYYQGGGAYMVGHRPEGVGLKIKNALSKAPAGRYPNAEVRRLRQAVARLVPGCALHQVLIFSSDEHRTRYLREEHGVYQIGSAFGDDASSAARWWRPYADTCEASRFILPVLPFGGDWNVAILVDRAHEEPDGGPDPGVPAFLAAGITSGIHAFLARQDYDPAYLELFDGPAFRREGPYLFPLWDARDHAKVFASGLEAGVLISPDHGVPSIVPGETSPGEQRAFTTWQEGFS